jgi:hypothetical protein
VKRRVKMTVRFNQFVAGRRSGKTTFLARAAVDAAENGEDVAVVLVNQQSIQSFGEACMKALGPNTNLSYANWDNVATITKVADYCEHCDRGEKTRGTIRFIARPQWDRSRYLNIKPVEKVFIDNVEFMASDDKSVEENLMDLVFEFVRPDTDLSVTVTSTERALELSGTLNF